METYRDKNDFDLRGGEKLGSETSARGDGVFVRSFRSIVTGLTRGKSKVEGNEGTKNAPTSSIRGELGKGKCGG